MLAPARGFVAAKGLQRACASARIVVPAVHVVAGSHAPVMGQQRMQQRRQNTHVHAHAGACCLRGRAPLRGRTLCRVTGSMDGADTVELDIKIEGMMCGGCT